MEISPRPLKFIALVLRNFIRNIGCSRAREDDMAARPVRDQATLGLLRRLILAGHNQCQAQRREKTHASKAKSHEFTVHIDVAPQMRGLRELEL
jgi:hypothetical protein